MSHDKPNPTTSLTLLQRLENGDAGTRREAQGEFAAKYALFIVSQVRRVAPTLQESDLHDVSQEILLTVCGGVIGDKYDAERAGFRRWFATVIRNRVRKLLERRGRQNGGAEGLSRIAAIDDSEEELERELERYIVQQAMGVIRSEFEDSTWQAFVATAVENRPAVDVANELGLSTNAVYVSKSRVLGRLRECANDLR
ncbi:MAG: sigma-70 family RNA polymerase sigma factor [Thermomicrobiales bacterium]